MLHQASHFVSARIEDLKVECIYTPFREACLLYSCSKAVPISVKMYAATALCQFVLWCKFVTECLRSPFASVARITWIDLKLLESKVLYRRFSDVVSFLLLYNKLLQPVHHLDMLQN